MQPWGGDPRTEKSENLESGKIFSEPKQHLKLVQAARVQFIPNPLTETRPRHPRPPSVLAVGPPQIARCSEDRVAQIGPFCFLASERGTPAAHAPGGGGGCAQPPSAQPCHAARRGRGRTLLRQRRRGSAGRCPGKPRSPDRIAANRVLFAPLIPYKLRTHYVSAARYEVTH